MDYEKKYKDALERAKEFQKSKDGLCVLTAESIFPELKESEDERIRKALVRFHKSTIDVDGIKGEEIVAWLEKQGEQKATNDTDEEIVNAVKDTSILDMIKDKDAFTDPGAFENSLGRLLKLFEKLPKQDLLDGLKFYANVVEHDGEYVKPAAWSEEDERIITALKKGFNYHQLFNPTFGGILITKIIDWLKSLKERLS